MRHRSAKLTRISLGVGKPKHKGVQSEEQDATKTQLTKYPDKKISETFLQFAEPLLEPIRPDATELDMEEPSESPSRYGMPLSYESVNGVTRYVEMVRELTAQHPLTPTKKCGR